MNILVTGSTGYIGGHFIETFADKYHFETFSLLDDTLDDVKLDNIDIILHCAALVHQKVAYDYVAYDDINVKYPISLAKKAKERGVKQFILLSTIAVYGDEIQIIDEKTECNPSTPYGKSKLKAEQQLEALKDENFIVSIIRPPMVYGKDAPGNMLSLVKLVNKVPILPFRKIENRRSFVYIGNLISYIDKIIEQHQGGIFLASDDTSLSTRGLIEHIVKASGGKVYLVHIPFFEFVLKRLNPSLHKRLYKSLKIDNMRSKEILDIQNSYSVEEGIKSMFSKEEK